MTPWIIRNIPFYKAFVRPHLGYTVLVWAPTAYKTRKLGYYNGNWGLPKTVYQDNWGHGPTPLSSRVTASQINDFIGTTNAWWLNQDFTSDPPSGPRSWFKLAFATEREFVDVLCSTASGVNSPLWMLDFPANGVNPRNLKIFECVRFKLVAINFANIFEKLRQSGQGHQQVNRKLLHFPCLLKINDAEMFSCHWKFSWSCSHFFACLWNSQFPLGCFHKLVRNPIMLCLHCFPYEIHEAHQGIVIELAIRVFILTHCILSKINLRNETSAAFWWTLVCFANLHNP